MMNGASKYMTWRYFRITKHSQQLFHMYLVIHIKKYKMESHNCNIQRKMDIRRCSEKFSA